MTKTTSTVWYFMRHFIWTVYSPDQFYLTYSQSVFLRKLHISCGLMKIYTTVHCVKTVVSAE